MPPKEYSLLGLRFEETFGTPLGLIDSESVKWWLSSY